MAPDPGVLLALGLGLYTLSLFGSQAMMSIGFFVAVLAVVATALRPGMGQESYRRAILEVWRSTWGRRYVQATLLLVAAWVASLVGAVLFPVEVGGVSPRVHWVRDLGKVIYLVWVIPCAAGLDSLNDARFERIRRVFLGAAFFAWGFCILELFTSWNPLSLVRNFPHARFGGLYTVNWLYGSYLTVASVMVFPFFYLLERALARAWPGRAWGLGLAGVGLVVLAGTMSRTLWVALPIGLACFGALRLKGRSRWLAVVAVLLIIGGASQLETVRQRLSYQRGYEQRYNLWKINWEFFKMRPVTGVGFQKNNPLSAGYYREFMPGVKGKLVSHAHNNWLEFMGSMGGLGLLAFLAWSGVTGWLAFAVSPGLGCAWVVFHLNGMTQVNFFETKTLHMLIWATAFAMASALRSRRTP